MDNVKCVLIHDNFQNFKSYNIPKLWGNGVALPCVYFVLSGIVWASGLDTEKQ